MEPIHEKHHEKLWSEFYEQFQQSRRLTASVEGVEATINVARLDRVSLLAHVTGKKGKEIYRSHRLQPEEISRLELIMWKLEEIGLLKVIMMYEAFRLSSSMTDAHSTSTITDVERCDDVTCVQEVNDLIANDGMKNMHDVDICESSADEIGRDISFPLNSVQKDSGLENVKSPLKLDTPTLPHMVVCTSHSDPIHNSNTSSASFAEGIEVKEISNKESYMSKVLLQTEGACSQYENEIADDGINKTSPKITFTRKRQYKRKANLITRQQCAPNENAIKDTIPAIHQQTVYSQALSETPCSDKMSAYERSSEKKTALKGRSNTTIDAIVQSNHKLEKEPEEDETNLRKQSDKYLKPPGKSSLRQKTRKVNNSKRKSTVHGSTVMSEVVMEEVDSHIPFICAQCLQSFSSSKHLMKHWRQHAENGIELEKHPKVFLCDVCHRAFSGHYKLKLHYRIHTGARPHSCQTCGKAFRLFKGLAVHLRTHTREKPYRCQSCPANFAEKKSLMYHMRSHSGEKTHVCELCGKQCPSLTHLNVHRRTHTGEKPFLCQLCSATFSQSSSLKTHLRIHKGDKPFNCEYCGWSFVSKSHLTTHLRTHTGERPYQCGQCSFTGPTPHSVRTHTLTHSQVKPFKCDTCAASFKRKSHLNAHSRTHLHDKLSVNGDIKANALLPSSGCVQEAIHKNRNVATTSTIPISETSQEPEFHPPAVCGTFISSASCNEQSSNSLAPLSSTASTASSSALQHHRCGSYQPELYHLDIHHQFQLVEQVNNRQKCGAISGQLLHELQLQPHKQLYHSPQQQIHPSPEHHQQPQNPSHLSKPQLPSLHLQNVPVQPYLQMLQPLQDHQSHPESENHQNEHHADPGSCQSEYHTESETHHPDYHAESETLQTEYHAKPESRQNEYLAEPESGQNEYHELQQLNVHQQWVSEHYQGMEYQPSGEVAQTVDRPLDSTMLYMVR